MSTKVYNLYKYMPNDPFQLYDWLPTLRESYYQYLIAQFSSLDVPQEKVQSTLLRATRMNLRDFFNIKASVVVYYDQEQVYAQFFGIDTEELIETTGDFVDCSYQDQSDQPDDVSDEEWEERRNLVERLFARDYGSRPSYIGLSFVLADEDDCYHIADRVQQAHKKE